MTSLAALEAPNRSVASTESPTWFGPPDRRLFGWLHLPASGIATSAVVLCPPLAREWASAHNCYRVLAEELAGAGMLALRFDYDGTGDSAGDSLDPGRVEAWLSSVRHAVDLVRSTGCDDVSLVGMRMGALLAASAAARVGPIEAVVLWDPCTSASAFVREQVALRRMVSDAPLCDEPSVELPGCVLSQDDVKDLTTLDVPVPKVPPSRVLLLTRPGLKPRRGLAEALGTTPTVGEALGQEQLLEVDLTFRELPRETLATVVSWLTEGSRAAPRRTRVRTCNTMTISSGGASATEQLVRIGPANLFGILTEPETPSTLPTVLMLNSGNNCHVGPSRLWVELSRRWAAMGFRSLRFDENGLGDSPTREGGAVQDIWSPSHFADVAEARSFVGEGDPSDVVIVGLCSGGYQALEAAIAQPVRAVYAINPVLRFSPPELAAGGGIDPNRRICWPTSDLVSDYRRFTSPALRRRLNRVLWPLLHWLGSSRTPRRALEQLGRSRVDVVVLCGTDEARQLGYNPAGVTSCEELGAKVRVEVIKGLDHSLVPASQQRHVASLLTMHLIELTQEPSTRLER